MYTVRLYFNRISYLCALTEYDKSNDHFDYFLNNEELTILENY